MNPDTARKCIDQLVNDPPEPLELFALNLPDDVFQGDVLDPVDFLGYGPGGDYVESSITGILVSHSCDMAQDDKVIFAACYPANHFEGHRSWGQIRRNRFYELMYLADVPSRGDIIVDLATVQTIPTAIVRDRLDQGNMTRVSSFSVLGHYFFIAKLTVHLLRAKEDDEVRNPPPPRGLLRRAIAAVRRTVRGASARTRLVWHQLIRGRWAVAAL
ncbi:MAG TPA: hypothetical protein VGA22_13490 [Gemmatimonadales bacterium]